MLARCDKWSLALRLLDRSSAALIAALNQTESAASNFLTEMHHLRLFCTEWALPKKESVMTAAPNEQCACPGCKCIAEGESAIKRNGKTWCSDACADLHPNGTPCPSKNCHCEKNSVSNDRTVSDAQTDQAVEETFPASDPISP
jgi:hypothetical protein